MNIDTLRPSGSSCRRCLGAQVASAAIVLISLSGALPAWAFTDERWEPPAAARDAGVQPGSAWSLQFSPVSVHANPSPDHVHPVALGLRRARGPNDFIGVSAFRNSFGQPSAYAFYGQRFYGGIPAQPKVFVEFTAGLMHGYVGERAEQVPLNVRGFSPVFTIAPGWQINSKLSTQLNLIGTVAVMWQLDWRFD